MILNIVMLVPSGFFMPLYFARYQKWYYALSAGFFMSLFIEVIQLLAFLLLFPERTRIFARCRDIRQTLKQA